MDPLSIVSLVGSGMKGLGGLAQTGIGLIQGIGGRREQKRLWKNRPQLGITEGEKSNDALYNLMAGATELPGQRQYEDKMGQAVAEGIYEGNRTAVSSLMANKNATDLYGKKIQAVQDLGLAFADYKQQRMQDLTKWNEQKTQLEQQRWNVNQYEPWNIKMNEATSRKQSGFATAWQGLDTMGSAVTDFAGTQMYADFLKKQR